MAIGFHHYYVRHKKISSVRSGKRREMPRKGGQRRYRNRARPAFGHETRREVALRGAKRQKATKGGKRRQKAAKFARICAPKSLANECHRTRNRLGLRRQTKCDAAFDTPTMPRPDNHSSTRKRPPSEYPIRIPPAPSCSCDTLNMPRIYPQNFQKPIVWFLWFLWF